MFGMSEILHRKIQTVRLYIFFRPFSRSLRDILAIAWFYLSSILYWLDSGSSKLVALEIALKLGSITQNSDTKTLVWKKRNKIARDNGGNRTLHTAQKLFWLLIEQLYEVGG